MTTRIKFEVTDIEALEAAHPDCVYSETRKGFDRSKVYAKIKASQVLGLAVPGVTLLADDQPELEIEEAKTAKRI